MLVHSTFKPARPSSRSAEHLTTTSQLILCAGNATIRRRAARAGLMTAHQTADYYMGIDFGTSGARVTVIDDEGTPAADHKQLYGPDGANNWTQTWERVLFDLISSLPSNILSATKSVAMDGTSATAVLVDAKTGRVLTPAKLYNEAQSHEAVAAAKAIAPPSHTATASTSTLCKLITWHLEGAWQQQAAAAAEPCLMHQADWLAYLLHGQAGVSDWNNALKLGYDPEVEAFPDWLTRQDYAHLLPRRVVAPSSLISHITTAAAARSGLPPGCIVCAGTTDSIAAFVAAGVTDIGEAVTSLGSTLAVKLLSDRRVDDAAFGVYSHRLGNSWLVGGASNMGGAVLQQYFTSQQLQQLTEKIDINKPTGLDYYPLLRPGERFPVNDPNMQPRLQPRPDDDVVFLQGMLESMSRIESQAYQLLSDLGASRVKSVMTAGGGSVNDKWTAMRAAALGVPVAAAKQVEASYGAALLARAGFKQQQQERGLGYQHESD